jgi:hypothetical protein
MCNRASGLLKIIVILIIVRVFWREISIAIGIYIAYLLLVALINWVMAHTFLTIGLIIGVASIYLMFRFNFIDYSKKWILTKLKLS